MSDLFGVDMDSIWTCPIDGQVCSERNQIIYQLDDNTHIMAFLLLSNLSTSYSKVHGKRNNLKNTALGWEPVSII